MRQWVRCSECGWVGYYDFVPYGLNSPVHTLPCHSFRTDAVRITAKQAKPLLAKYNKAQARRGEP